MKRRDYIIFSSINWSTHWQLHHHLVTSIINSGGNVLFVENTGVRPPRIQDFGRIIDRIKSRLRSNHGFRRIDSQLTLFSPIFFPFPYRKEFIFLNTMFISKSIEKWTRAANFQEFVCISFLPTPVIQEVIKYINPKLVVYYCADDMSRTLLNSSKLKNYENRFFQDSDIIFTTSHKIYNRALKFSNFVHNIPSGIDADKFLSNDESLAIPTDVENISHPIIGYVGAISEVFDQKLVLGLAKKLPHANILLVGPKYTNISDLEGVKNIIILGERVHDLMPSYISNFDVAIIPYIINDSTDSVYSCKLNEYLAMGKAVVSTNLLEVRIFNKKNADVIGIGLDSSDFFEKVKWFINNKQSCSTGDFRDIRINISKENTWDKRFLKIEEIINKSISSKSDGNTDWRSNFSKIYYHYTVLRLFRRKVVFLVFLVFLVFYTPLFWFLGDFLVVKDFPHKSDAIVVFSGDGEVDYRNSSYQKRALDAIKFYNGGYARNIILSSGREQTISEVKIIKLFLVSNGIPGSSIHILDKYPSSTYQNIEMVSDILDKKNINSILFVTSPYHSLRSVLIWNKYRPDLKITAPKIIDTHSQNIQWNMDLGKIRVIIYEYMAIVYNWVLGRI